MAKPGAAPRRGRGGPGIDPLAARVDRLEGELSVVMAGEPLPPSTSAWWVRLGQGLVVGGVVLIVVAILLVAW